MDKIVYSSTKNIKEVIKKYNKNIKDNNIKSVNDGNKEQISIVFDEFSEQIFHKEKNDPLYLPLIGSNSQSNEDSTAYFDLNDDGNVTSQIKNKEEEQILVQHSIIQQFLGGLLDTNNEILKYEYIEMVRRGMEDENLLYLLSDPQERIIKNNKEREKLKQKLNKKIIDYTQLYEQTNKDTQSVMESQKKYMSDLISKCRSAQEKAKKVVGKFFKYSSTDPRVLKPNKRYQSLLNYLSDSQKYQKYLESKAKTQAQQRNDKINQATERREEIFLKKRKEMLSKIEQKSAIYSQEEKILKEVKKREAAKKKIILQYLSVEQTFNFFRQMITLRSKQKYEINLREAKAKIIQKQYRIYKVKQKLQILSCIQRELLRAYALRTLKRIGAKKVVLHFLKKKLKEKIRTNLKAVISYGIKKKISELTKQLNKY